MIPLTLLLAAAASTPPREPPMPTPCCSVLELRQYTLVPGKRDVLIELFERAFIEGQEAVGMRVVGQFRDLDRADRLVLLPGFDGNPAPPGALEAFYGDAIVKGQ